VRPEKKKVLLEVEARGSVVQGEGGKDMRLKQERMAAKRDTFRQIDLSAATMDADEQYRWLREKRKPKKERKRREPESLSLFT